MIKNPNCVLVQFQSNGRSVSSFAVSSLRRSQETRPGKRISDFRQKSRRAFRLKRLNNAVARGAGAQRSPRRDTLSSVRNYKEKNIAAYFLILNGGPNDEPERYMLNMRCPPQSCLIVFSCSERVGFHFVGGGGKDFY